MSYKKPDNFWFHGLLKGFSEVYFLKKIPEFLKNLKTFEENYTKTKVFKNGKRKKSEEKS